MASPTHVIPLCVAVLIHFERGCGLGGLFALELLLLLLLLLGFPLFIHTYVRLPSVYTYVCTNFRHFLFCLFIYMFCCAVIA
jgi:hypothetical protein